MISGDSLEVSGDSLGVSGDSLGVSGAQPGVPGPSRGPMPAADGWHGQRRSPTRRGAALSVPGTSQGSGQPRRMQMRSRNTWGEDEAEEEPGSPPEHCRDGGAAEPEQGPPAPCWDPSPKQPPRGAVGWCHPPGQLTARTGSPGTRGSCWRLWTSPSWDDLSSSHLLFHHQPHRGSWYCSCPPLPPVPQSCGQGTGTLPA